MKTQLLLAAVVLGLSSARVASAAGPDDADFFNQLQAGADNIHHGAVLWSVHFSALGSGGGKPPAPAPVVYWESQRQPVLRENVSDGTRWIDPASGSTVSDGTEWIENVRWGRRDSESHYWDVAAINPRQVEEVYWGQEEVGVGHAFLVFKFKPGAFVSDRDGAYASDYLVISVEARMKVGDKYNPVAGQFGAYKSQVWNMATLESFVQDDVVHDGTPFGLYPFMLDPLQKRMMAELALSKAVHYHENDAYNTLANNCGTNALAMFDAVVNPPQEIHSVVPMEATKTLKDGGWLGPKIVFNAQEPTGGGMIAGPRD